MTTQLRAVLAGLILAVGALAAVVGVGRHDGTDSPDAAAPPRGPYVALGDSYTSGPDIPGRTGEPVGCDRSDHNYPSLIADRLKLKAADFRDMSCSGASITDLTTPQATKNGTNPAQLTALSSKTRLVTVGIGGNDVGFSPMITRCVVMGTAYDFLGSGKYVSEDAPCEKHYVEDGTDTTLRKIATMRKQLSDVLKEVARRAPEARVYVVGYPAILPSDGTGCDRELPLAPGDIAYLGEKQRQLNTALREQAGAADTTYVDTYTPSRKHHACSAEATRWIEPLRPAAPAAAVHPNARGERGMADAVLGAMEPRG